MSFLVGGTEEERTGCEGLPRGLVGLRVDVCTYRGCREGLPALLSLLERQKVRATIFVAMGPDRSGRAVLRLFRKRGFLQKMLRTGAARMYGIRTALYGTLLPSPVISQRCASVLRRAVDAGHEVGIHSWNHVEWQDHLDSLSSELIRGDYEKAIAAYEEIVGRRPTCTASPAWILSDASLAVADTLGFQFASDSRGWGPYLPRVQGRTLSLPQIPVTLPTLDEALGRAGVTAAGFHEHILASLTERVFPVHTAHAEAEGRSYIRHFERLLEAARSLGWRFVPLGETLAAAGSPLPACPVERGPVEGRAGEVSLQGGRPDSKGGTG